jgi:PAS domain S-box-containing protein
MIDQKENPGNDILRSAKELDSCAEVLRDASFLFEEKIEELSLLSRIGNIVSYIFDQEVFYQRLVDILLEETNAENCSFMLMDADSKELVLKIARGRNDEGTFFDHPGGSGTTFSLGEGIAGKAALNRKTFLIDNAVGDKRFEARETRFPIGSLLCTPLIFRGKILGVINLSHTQPYAFGENKRRVMELLCAFVSSLIGSAIDYIKMKDQEKFRAMFEGVKLSILLIDSKTSKIVDCNSHTEGWLGYGKKELIGTEDFFCILSNECREETKKMLNGIIEKNNSEFHELSFIKMDGSTTIAETNGTVISYQERDVIQLTIRDVTEKKEMEAKLLRSEKLKALGELAGGVAHDFNNVLAAIMGRAQLLRMNSETLIGKEGREKSIDTLKKGLDIIEKAARDGAETVRRIQEFSRKGSNDKYFMSVDMNKVVENVLEIAKVKWKNEADSKGIKIDVQKMLSSLPLIAGSASELREVFTNLINNAIDAMPQGGKLTIKTFKQDGHIAVKVEDTGIGIPETIRNNIFDPFFTTKGPQSAGLGMSVSYGIINRHGGTITVDSVEGQGTSVAIKFPELKKTGEKKNREEKAKRISKEQKKSKILVIEDEKGVRLLLEDILTDVGHEVKTASNGSKGVEIFKENSFDLVFTDLGMPGMSGWQVAKEIKKISKKTPVALITGWEVKLNDSELKKSGVDLVINKPFRVEQVVRLVQDGMALRNRPKKVV